MHREFGIINSYTLEISFCGPTQGLHKDTHFSQQLLRVSFLAQRLMCVSRTRDASFAKVWSSFQTPPPTATPTLAELCDATT